MNYPKWTTEHKLDAIRLLQKAEIQMNPSNTTTEWYAIDENNKKCISLDPKAIKWDTIGHVLKLETKENKQALDQAIDRLCSVIINNGEKDALAKTYKQLIEEVRRETG